MATENIIDITPRAKSVLVQLLTRSSFREPVFTIARGMIPETGGIRWGVAAYELENLSPGTTVSRIDGFDFYFDPHVLANVTGRTLDFDEGQFRFL